MKRADCSAGIFLKILPKGEQAGFCLPRTSISSIKKTRIKEPFGNTQLFRLARRDLFLKQERTLPCSTVSKKVKQSRQTEQISVSSTAPERDAEQRVWAKKKS